jgi:transposase-like protein
MWIIAMISFKGRQFDKHMMLQSIRWYLAYNLSYRNLEEMMAERGFHVDHISCGSQYNQSMGSTLCPATRAGISWNKEAPK